ncbi:hypothetical protein FA09DRAFT_345243 [Tilletiopsis washingtonensis]|uniref:SIN1-domain-containing protein n=1 Tax=Tilletiopsis washingtonensis TaxID=58919 RepID=A0A316ZIH3_9BASI|nr:hypothetical protein FA09DRAFT_345243 [Tilletiopsis washingtonensis]PWO00126.1 hypothetical protein FA09DRAFT_345243 [Tilletiopsis washingtonensis]
MSLIADPDYVIHSLRLAYLRHIDDVAGPRILSFPSIAHLDAPITGAEGALDEASSSSPSRRSGGGHAEAAPLPAHDSHVVVAGLTSARCHPELRAVHSPKLRGASLSSGASNAASASSAQPASGPAPRVGAGLKYTNTIYGAGRSGALGMRVSGRRAPSLDEPSGSSSRSRPTRRRSAALAEAAGRQAEDDSLRVSMARRGSMQSGTSGTAGAATASLMAGRRSLDVPALTLHAASGESGRHQRLVAPSSSFSDSGLSSPPLGPGSRPVERSASIAGPAPERQRDAALPQGRRRSASEGAKALLGMTRDRGAEEEEMNSHDDDVESVVSATPGLPRLESNSTVFSLASVPSSRPRPSLNLERQGSVGGGADNTPMNTRHFFTPVTEIDEPHFTSHGRSSTSDDERADAGSSVRPLHMRKISGTTDSSVPDIESSTGASSTSASSPAPHFARMRASTLPRMSPGQPQAAPPAQLEEEEAEQALAQSLDDVEPAAPILSALGLDTADESLAPVPHVTAPSDTSRDRPPAAGVARQPAPSQPRSRSQLRAAASMTGASNEYFASLKRDVRSLAARPAISSLSAQLKAQSAGPANPFSNTYAGVGARSGGGMTLTVYFPWAATQPRRAGKPSSEALSLDGSARSMQLSVRRDASMEEVVGYALACYVDEAWLPHLDDGIEAKEQDRLDNRLSTIGWALRIVEDGEVDDDYPAIDRSLLVGKFGADELAVVEATPAQVRQHLAALTPAQKAARAAVRPTPRSDVDASGPSRLGASTLPAPQAARLAAAASNAPAGSLVTVQGTPIFASSALSRSALGSEKPIFLRVAVTPNAAVRYKTTLQVPSDMYLADVLEMICRKRQLASPDEWALIVPDKKIVAPLDRTVESLEGNHDLALVKRSSLGAQGGAGALTAQSTNPSASIFKRLSEPGQPRYNKAKDVASTYKSYTLNRKMPMSVGRHERTLTLDGDWVHIIPNESRATQLPAASFPISSVLSCAQSTKVPASFKLVTAKKRYDFEAGSPREAAEIVGEINKRMAGAVALLIVGCRRRVALYAELLARNARAREGEATAREENRNAGVRRRRELL